MIRKLKGYSRLPAFLAAVATILSFSEPVLAIDDGARAYWKGRDGTQVVSFQYLNWDIQAAGTQQFDPAQYTYPNSDTEARVFIGSWARHMTLLNRPLSLAVNLVGGSVDVDVNTNVPLQLVPTGMTPGIAFSQSASGYADPTIQLDVNLFGTPPLKSGVDLLNYEPTWTLDLAMMLGFPIGKYDDDKLVNLGQNRWFGRVAVPFKYHFGVFAPGYMSSLELIPSVWIFAPNNDFINQKLENDPLWQVEAHLTQDFTRSFFGSLDLLYRSGFQSEIDGVNVGHELRVGNLGFTLNYQATDNIAIRTGFSSNMFGDDDLDNSILRIQFAYAWHSASESAKKLLKGH